MSLGVYDSKQVSVTFGPILITGYADGTFISVEQNEDSFSLLVGADGDACRSKSNNRSARVTLTILQSSPANDLLSALHNEDVLSPSGDGVQPLMVKDNSGRTICAAERAWIVKPPTTEYAVESGSREWLFETDNMLHNVGGN